MESAANLHHQLTAASSSSSSSSSSSLPIPHCFGLASSHVWTPNIALNSGQKSSNNLVVSPINSSMVQDLGFQWTGINSGSLFSQSVHGYHDLNAGKIKEEMSAESFPKFNQMLNCPSTTNEDLQFIPSTNHVNNDDNAPPPQEYLDDLSHKLLLKTLISSGCQITGSPMKAGEIYSGGSVTSRNIGHFSQIYPSINVSNWNLSSSPAFSNSLDLNLQTPPDMVVSTRCDVRNFSHNSQENFGVFKEGLPYSHHDQMHKATVSCDPSKTTTFSSEVTEAKRPCMEPRVNQAHPTKKTRLEPRASCPPFKIRKEKLGDRIAALQQLVAPFGKTDTASVLMEAVGYIKFLQNQVETLSVPYMKPSSNKTSKPTRRSSVEDGSAEPKRDLRSRGLCLVPLGCLSYVTGDGGGGVGIWPPPGFNGETS